MIKKSKTYMRKNTVYSVICVTFTGIYPGLLMAKHTSDEDVNGHRSLHLAKLRSLKASAFLWYVWLMILLYQVQLISDDVPVSRGQIGKRCWKRNFCLYCSMFSVRCGAGHCPATKIGQRQIALVGVTTDKTTWLT